MRVATVLKSGGEYTPEHVIRLRDQLLEFLPDIKFICFSDVKIRGVDVVPHWGKWPGWWSKMNMFHPMVRGDLLYFDLDTSIVGDLSEIAKTKQLTLMRDVYRPHGLQSSMMLLPEKVRAPVWLHWLKNPAGYMMSYKRGGDQEYLELHWLDRAVRWQDILPGQVVSYKGDKIKRNGTPEDARVVIFHGKPRPWEVGW